MIAQSCVETRHWAQKHICLSLVFTSGRKMKIEEPLKSIIGCFCAVYLNCITDVKGTL